MQEKELQERLAALEERIARLEAAPRASFSHHIPAPHQGFSKPAPEGVYVSMIGKAILIVGGAYVLRALTELHVVPSGVGVALGFAYALFWVSRLTPLYAATGAAIAGALSWEAATRFHIIGSAGGGVLIAIAALVLLWRSTQVHAIVAAVMTIIASIGVAIGTGDALPAAITVAVIGLVVSLSGKWDTYLTAGIAAADDSIAITLIALTLFERAPHDVLTVEIALVAIAGLWAIAPFVSPRWPEIAQAILATAIGLGGAALLVQVRGANPAIPAIAAIAAGTFFYWRSAKTSLLSIAGAVAAAVAMLLVTSGLTLSVCFALAAVITSKRWPEQSVFWSIGAIAFGFTSAIALPIAGAAALIAFLVVREGPAVRFALLTVFASAALLTIMKLAPPASRSLVAFEWTALLALTIAVLSLLASRIPEAATLARLLLIIAGIKVVVEDLRVGQATTLVASLALYGGAMLVFARRRPAGALNKEEVQT